MQANVVSLSGGKDSTAVLLHMIERGESIGEVLFFDTGWEFPAMYTHLDKLEKDTGIPITRIGPRLPGSFNTPKSEFDFMYSEYPVRHRKTGEVHKIGRGWPAPRRRWCTGRKQEAVRAYQTALTYKHRKNLPLRICIGFAADEKERIAGYPMGNSPFLTYRFPLDEWGWTEADALRYCREKGYDWDGLYEHFDRLSCFCCPLQPMDSLRTLRTRFPDLWDRMREMESWLPEGDNGRRFKKYASVSDLDARFAAEDAERTAAAQ